jgi:hypothetical protein
VVPEGLRPLLEGTPRRDVIDHHVFLLKQAMSITLTLEEMQAEPRLQVYRTAIDSLLSWLSIVRKAIDRGLFSPIDIEPIAWWIYRIDEATYLNEFIRAFGYERDIERMKELFAANVARLRTSQSSPPTVAEH